jgi:hypothetical protein
LCLGKKVFSYLPVIDSRFDEGIPNKVVPSYEKEDEIIKAIDDVINNDEKYNELLKKYRREDLNQYISGLDYETDVFSSYKEVLDLVEVRKNKLNALVLKIKYKIYNSISLLLNREKRKKQVYIRQKYPYTPLSEWIKILKDMDKANGTTFSKLNFEKLSKDAYIIRK